MEIYKKYKKDVEMVAGRYFKRYGYKCDSYEDLKQTICYILLCAIEKFDGLISIVKYNRKPPYCKETPFTPLKMEYISGDDENNCAFKEFQGEYIV
ncbi:RNA polymerase subunit sigma-24 [Thermosipho affectus]|uniref:RNA polymerase subunit sigma-24 n=1 Tax=Thermosipho affectus TaxID=660294 RepID=A0ABX3IJK2_9BACT|nr:MULTISPECIES: RNA polymerase subunit sigma-24 [Thermosipho]ANQ53646.1 RNA polymerase subunit sigma-24 [Thermosipho sp. 1070]ONN27371.1 RNA polymerase subunit sigma-24 [Thermosipho affectus]